jgi:hypothetical protein
MGNKLTLLPLQTGKHENVDAEYSSDSSVCKKRQYEFMYENKRKSNLKKYDASFISLSKLHAQPIMIFTWLL